MDQTLYQELGGEKTVQKATFLLYANILRDKRIKNFFENVDLDKQRRKMDAFLTYIFGGPSLYLGKDMRKAHKNIVKNGLNDVHVDAMMDCVRETLHDLEIDEDKINRVTMVIEDHRKDVLNR